MPTRNCIKIRNNMAPYLLQSCRRSSAKPNRILGSNRRLRRSSVVILHRGGATSLLCGDVSLSTFDLIIVAGWTERRQPFVVSQRDLDQVQVGERRRRQQLLQCDERDLVPIFRDAVVAGLDIFGDGISDIPQH